MGYYRTLEYRKKDTICIIEEINSYYNFMKGTSLDTKPMRRYIKRLNRELNRRLWD